MKRIATLIMAALIVAGTVEAGQRKVKINQKRLQARRNQLSDQPGTSGHAIRKVIQKLAATGFTPVPQSKEELIGALPDIIDHVQGLLDAKDVQLANKITEIVAHKDANQFKLAFEDQVIWDNMMRQRTQIQDGYNEIQSWAIAYFMRTLRDLGLI